MKNHLQGVLEKKIKSIKNLAEKTEVLRDNYTYRDPLEAAEVEYFNSKNLSKGLTLEIDPKFSPSIKINKNSSVVHIPTDVYSGGVKILNTIKWTDGLDPYFKENDKQDPSLLWQYFGSSDGVYRVYPGFGWPDKSENDVFDNRRRGWYIQGSSSPKDLVLLLDLSGSMAGQKLSILKLAAMSLLETLQENDFVNIVVVFANEDSDDDDNEVDPYMVCQVKKDGSVEKNREKVAHCSDHLLQATQQNKKYLKNFIPNVKARGIAAVSKGFERAIEVLKNSQREKRNFTSSGCTQAIILFTDGIEDSQAEKTTEILQEKNAGKQIRVFTYLLGREKSATDKPLRKITNEYRGCFFRIKTLSDVREKVLAYVTVLSRPLGFAVADTGPDPSWTPIYYDKLGLGLMITLVAPVFNRTKDRELLGVVGTDVALPQLEASVPGSEVGVNGYGFAINNNGFLVFHPSLNKEKDPPNIALDEVEYNAVGAEKLTRKMIDRLTGNMTFQNRLISEHKHRLSWSEEFHYFYSPVENTSFSAAIAIPKSSLYSLDATGFTGLKQQFLTSSDKNEFVIVAPWKICPRTPVAADSETPVYLTAYPTAQDIINDNNLNANCNNQKLKNLLFDANATKEAAARYWNAEDNSKEGIDNVFVATHGGIMRWLNSSSLASPLKRNYTKEEFYTQAAQYADKGEKERIIVFSAPYRAADYEPDVNETATITASSPVVLTEDTNVVVAAVAGMHVKHEYFSNLFADIISSSDCNSEEGCTIRLIDDDGFIVASNESDSEVGKFLGLLEGAVMMDFLNRSMFEKLTFTSVQEECKQSDVEQKESSARTLLNPLFAVTSYVQFWTQTVFWSLAQFSIYSFFSHNGVAMAEEEKQEEKKIPCSKELKFYKGVWDKRTIDEFQPCENSENCDWPVYMAPVPHTNLRLLVIKRICACENNPKLTTSPQPLMSDPVSPRNVSYRKPPEFKPPCNDMQEQGKPPCALASLSSPQNVAMVFLLLVALFIPNNNIWR